MSLETIAAVEGESMRPIWVLLISVAWVVLSIAKFKIHPFLSLMVGALLWFIIGPLPETTIENKGLFIAGSNSIHQKLVTLSHFGN